MAVLLCYNFNKDQVNKLRVLGSRIGTKIRAVQPCEYSLSILSLAQGETAKDEASPSDTFSDRMLIQCSFQNRQINALLQGLRAMRLSDGVIKAVMTETNSAWNSLALHKELCAERDAFLRGERTHEEPEK